MSAANETHSGSPLESFVKRQKDSPSPSESGVKPAAWLFEPLLQIVWSPHAVQRMAERFGCRKDMTIPNEKIAQRAQCVDVGGRFKVRDSGAIYVCERRRASIVIVTVVQKRKRHRSNTK